MTPPTGQHCSGTSLDRTHTYLVGIVASACDRLESLASSTALTAAFDQLRKLTRQWQATGATTKAIDAVLEQRFQAASMSFFKSRDLSDLETMIAQIEADIVRARAAGDVEKLSALQEEHDNLWKILNDLLQ